MPFLGLTGTFCSGKTTVLNMFSLLGAATLNVDELTFVLYKRGTSIYKKLLKEFGEKILDVNKEIDRKKLAKIVFSSEENLKKIEKIVHPFLINAIKEFLKKQDRKKQIVVVEVPLLFEKRLAPLFDYTICVSTYKKNSVERAKKRFGICAKEINRIMEFQMSLEEKEKKADFLIKNYEDLETLKKEVEKLWRRIQKLN